MAEQHRVGDAAEERGADHGAGDASSAAGSPAWMPAATRPTTPMSGATRSSAGGNSGTPVEGTVRRRGRCRSSPRPAPTAAPTRSRSSATPARRRTIDTPSATAAASATSAAHASRTGTDVDANADDRGRGRHQEIRPAQQPAVADADLAPPGRDPEEQQAAGRPLQQHRRGVELDHRRASARSGIDDDEVVVDGVERVGPGVGGDDDVFDPGAPLPGK